MNILSTIKNAFAAPSPGKHCFQCKKLKLLEDFQRDASSTDDRRSTCRECSNARRRKWMHQKPLERPAEKEFTRKTKQSPLQKKVAPMVQKIPIPLKVPIEPIGREKDDLLELLEKVCEKHQAFFCLSVSREGKCWIQIHTKPEKRKVTGQLQELENMLDSLL